MIKSNHMRGHGEKFRKQADNKKKRNSSKMNHKSE